MATSEQKKQTTFWSMDEILSLCLHVYLLYPRTCSLHFFGLSHFFHRCVCRTIAATAVRNYVRNAFKFLNPAGCCRRPCLPHIRNLILNTSAACGQILSEWVSFKAFWRPGPRYNQNGYQNDHFEDFGGLDPDIARIGLSRFILSTLAACVQIVVKYDLVKHGDPQGHISSSTSLLL